MTLDLMRETAGVEALLGCVLTSAWRDRGSGGEALDLRANLAENGAVTSHDSTHPCQQSHTSPSQPASDTVMEMAPHHRTSTTQMRVEQPESDS